MKELWLQNLSKTDLNLSDLGVKVGINKTINVYDYNPYLTEDQVKKSVESGSVCKRLGAGLMRIVDGPPSSKEVPQVKATNKTVEVVRSKSSVLVDMKSDEMLEAEDLVGIADYGMDGLGESVKVISVPGDAVVVEQKDDRSPNEKSEPKAKFSVVPGQMTEGHSIMVNADVEPADITENKDTKTDTDSDSKEADAEVEMADKKEKTEDKKDGMRIATKTDDGITVMKVKE